MTTMSSAVHQYMLGISKTDNEKAFKKLEEKKEQKLCIVSIGE